MAIRQTTWHPDTCECVIVYTWDDTTSEDERVHTPHSVLKACPAHTGKTVRQHHETITEENQRKNHIHGYVLEHMPELTVERDGGKGLHPAVTLEWSFDKQRNLNVALKGSLVRPGDVQALKEHAAKEFGQTVRVG